jgi:hypothetical protein
MDTQIPDGSILLLSDARGIYQPRDFAQEVKRECVANVSDADWQTLLDGPDGESYWDAWSDVCDRAVVTAPDTGVKYTIYQDGDTWLVPVDAEWGAE